MNLPNKLTLLRVLLVPFFVVFLLMDLGFTGDLIALVIFCVASITDFLDGYLARKWNLVTNFGKFMDPMADKLLVSSAVICLLGIGRIPAWVVVILIGREFVISSFRLVACEKGVVIAAGYWGKFKTAFQMFMTIALILHFDMPAWHYLEIALIAISTILCIVSLVDYLWANRDVIKDFG